MIHIILIFFQFPAVAHSSTWISDGQKTYQFDQTGDQINCFHSAEFKRLFIRAMNQTFHFDSDLQTEFPAEGKTQFGFQGTSSSISFTIFNGGGHFKSVSSSTCQSFELERTTGPHDQLRMSFSCQKIQKNDYVQLPTNNSTLSGNVACKLEQI